MKTVTLVEINVYEGMVPLVSAYLEAYAKTDPAIAGEYRFRKHSLNRKTPVTKIFDEITRYHSDVFALSCYIWNMGIVKTLVSAVMSKNPDAYILLGGPQVMHHAHDYLDPGNEKLVICNGEGEVTFASFLKQLMNNEPDLLEVRGLSFYRDRELVMTPPQERIRNLDDIPSPFQEGLIDGNYRVCVLETNRGCPFRCGFCFWGAATNDKVCKFSDERVREDLSWIGRSEIPFIVIADANWGMLNRDIEFSRQIVECKETYGTPVYVYFSAAKNSPKRVAEITQIFQQAGVFNAQPISMQSLDESSLKQIDRQNIKLTAYQDLQDDLNDKGISSFIELIWPLPGETLQSFKEGIEKLCDRGAANLVVYPHLLLHNTPLYEKQKEYGLISRRVDDDAAEAEIVVETADVSGEEFEKGMWFYYTVLALHNTRSLHGLRSYLHSTGIMSFSELFTAFSEFCASRDTHAFSEFCNTSISEAHYYDVFNYPMVYFLTLHKERSEFDRLLRDFSTTQAWWNDEKARFLFEIGMLTRPFLFSNTPFVTPPTPFQVINVLDASSRRYVIEIPEEYLALVDELDTAAGNRSGASVYQLDHKTVQLPYRPGQSTESVADYCSGVVMRATSVMPQWSAL